MAVWVWEGAKAGGELRRVWPRRGSVARSLPPHLHLLVVPSRSLHAAASHACPPRLPLLECVVNSCFLADLRSPLTYPPHAVATPLWRKDALPDDPAVRTGPRDPGETAAMICITVLDPGVRGDLCVHVRPSQNSPHSLLFNCPPGTQRMFSSTPLHMGAVSDILFTHLSAVTLEGLPGFLLTRHNPAKGPVDVRLVVPRHWNLSFFDQLNSHSMSRFWGGQLQAVDIPIAAGGIPVVRTPDCTVTAFSPLLGTAQGVGCAYLAEFWEEKRKMRKDVIEKYRLTAQDCKRLCAGESVSAKPPEGSGQTPASPQPSDGSGGPAKIVITPDDVFYRPPCPGYLIILPPADLCIESRREDGGPSPGGGTLTVSPLIDCSLFTRPSCCFMHVADFGVYHALGWVAAYREANAKNKLFLYGTPTPSQLFRLCRTSFRASISFDRACWDQAGPLEVGITRRLHPTFDSRQESFDLAAGSPLAAGQIEFDRQGLPEDLRRELDEVCASLYAEDAVTPYRSCEVLRLLWSRGRDAVSASSPAEGPEAPPGPEAFLSRASYLHTIALTPGEIQTKAGFCSGVTSDEVEQYLRRKNIGESTLEALPPLAGPIVRPADFAQGEASGNALETLGTGASLPSKYRNVSSNLLRLGSFYYMVDAGEGTLGQLNLMHTAREVNHIILRLRALFITHSHADHYLGILSIIRAKILAYRFLLACLSAPSAATDSLAPAPAANARLVPLDIYCSKSVKEYITYTFDMVTDVKLDPEILNFHILDDSVAGTSFFYNPGVVMHVFLAQHVHDSLGVAFADRGAKEIYVFSGDTRPTESLVRAAWGLREFCGGSAGPLQEARPSLASGITLPAADGYRLMLIHECTFSQEFCADALERGHSTVMEACSQGVKCGADVIVLTHFSQRFCKTAPDIGEVIDFIESAAGKRAEQAAGPAAGSIAEPVAEPVADRPVAPPAPPEAKPSGGCAPAALSAAADESAVSAVSAEDAGAPASAPEPPAYSPSVILSADMLLISFDTAKLLAEHSTRFYSLIDCLD